MKILVIGSEGFIGRHLIKLLQQAGNEVKGFDLVQEEARRNGYCLIQGNILDSNRLKNAAEGCEMVINLAAKHHDFGVSRQEFFSINETGTGVILKVMAELGIRQLVFFSSVAVYGDVAEESSEVTPLNPANDYGASKLAGEQLIQAWVKDNPLRSALIMRPPVVYGPYNYANMFRLIDNLYRRRFVMVGRGKNIKSIAYVENLTAATLFMIQRMQPGLSVVNYSDCPQHTSIAIANLIQKELGRPALRLRLPVGFVAALALPLDFFARVSNKNLPITAKRIRKFALMNTKHGSGKLRAMGFQQPFKVEEGIRHMVKWYLEHGRFKRERCARGPLRG